MEYISKHHVTGLLDSYATELTKHHPLFYAYTISVELIIGNHNR
jgi:hypothetical protein